MNLKYTLFFVLTTCSLNSQTTGYLPLDVGNEWIFDNNSYIKIRVEGERNMNGVVYKLLTMPHNLDTVYLRQQEGKVYRYYRYDSTERIYYDFTASIDQMFYDHGGYYIKCVQNNMITYLGSSRRVWGFSYGRSCADCSFTDYLIDNIGWSGLNGAFYTNRLTEVVLNGNRIITKVVEKAPSQRISYNLSLDVFPNPFNPVATVVYSVPFNSFISIDLYDILGRNCKNIFKGSAGESMSLSLNGNDLSSGMYFVTLSTENNFVTKKIFLIK